MDGPRKSTIRPLLWVNYYGLQVLRVTCFTEQRFLGFLYWIWPKAKIFMGDLEYSAGIHPGNFRVHYSIFRFFHFNWMMYFTFGLMHPTL
jgi:hypothetical protein